MSVMWVDSPGAIAPSTDKFLRSIDTWIEAVRIDEVRIGIKETIHRQRKMSGAHRCSVVRHRVGGVSHEHGVASALPGKKQLKETMDACAECSSNNQEPEGLANARNVMYTSCPTNKFAYRNQHGPLTIIWHVSSISHAQTH